MHGWIEYSMNIPLFSFLMCSMYVCFYDGEEVTAWAKRVGNRLSKWRIHVHFPSGTQLRPSAAAFLDAVDPFKLVSYSPSTTTEWNAERSDGRRVSPSVASGSRSIGSYVFALVPGIWKRLLLSSTEPAEAIVPVPSPAPSPKVVPKRKAKR